MWSRQEKGETDLSLRHCLHYAHIMHTSKQQFILALQVIKMVQHICGFHSKKIT